MKVSSLKLILLVFSLTCSIPNSFAKSGRLEPNLLRIRKIAKAIQLLQPRLKPTLSWRYASHIELASKAFDVNPNILIAIAMQESGFKQHWGKGNSGELGIMQIRSVWLQDPQFKKQFPWAEIKHLMLPKTSFLFAAWILKHYSKNRPPSPLPHWAYYNANKYKNRLKYSSYVGRHLARLKKHDILVQNVSTSTH